MYNRYIRSEDGAYDRIPQQEIQDTAPAAPRNPPVDAAPKHSPSSSPQASERSSSASPHHASSSVHQQSMPHQQNTHRPPESGFLEKLLSRLHLGDIDSGDLILLLLLFFLFHEDGDEELLIAIGLLLIL